MKVIAFEHNRISSGMGRRDGHFGPIRHRQMNGTDGSAQLSHPYVLVVVSLERNNFSVYEVERIRKNCKHVFRTYLKCAVEVPPYKFCSR